MGENWTGVSLLFRYLPPHGKAILLVLVGIVLLITCLVRFVGRKGAAAFGYLLAGCVVLYFGVGMYRDTEPFAKQKKLLPHYADDLATLVHATAPAEIAECYVLTTEVYGGITPGTVNVYGHIRLRVQDYLGVVSEIPVDASWDDDKQKWDSVAEKQLKLLALDQLIDHAERTRATLRSLSE